MNRPKGVDEVGRPDCSGRHEHSRCRERERAARIGDKPLGEGAPYCLQPLAKEGRQQKGRTMLRAEGGGTADPGGRWTGGSAGGWRAESQSRDAGRAARNDEGATLATGKTPAGGPSGGPFGNATRPGDFLGDTQDDVTPRAKNALCDGGSREGCGTHTAPLPSSRLWNPAHETRRIGNGGSSGPDCSQSGRADGRGDHGRRRTAQTGSLA